MLVLSRKLNQSIVIGEGDIEVIVVSLDRDQVKLGIKAPRSVAVHRSEVYLEIQRVNEQAASAASEATNPDEQDTPSTATLRAAPNQ